MHLALVGVIVAGAFVLGVLFGPGVRKFVALISDDVTKELQKELAVVKADKAKVEADLESAKSTAMTDLSHAKADADGLVAKTKQEWVSLETSLRSRIAELEGTVRTLTGMQPAPAAAPTPLPPAAPVPATTT